jgi:hypothetical protein
VVSTKYGAGDFVGHLPYNPTLRLGRNRRLVEFQARREFEGFGAFPNYLGHLHQGAIQSLCKDNPNIEGIWLWTQRGGPLRAGPLSLYPFCGFWLLIDSNVYITGRLAWNPKADLHELTEIWIRKNFGKDPNAVGKLLEIFFLSRKAVLKGHYVEAFSKQRLRALGTEVPTLAHVWDMVGGSSAVLTGVFLSCKGRLQESIAEGFQAVRIVQQMRRIAGSIDKSQVGHVYNLKNLNASLEYEESLLDTLAWYRKAFLSFYQWTHCGSSHYFTQWETAYDTYLEKRHMHLSTYENNLDFPAYNFSPADVGMAHAQRSLTMAWLARFLLVIALGIFFGGSNWGQRVTGAYPGKDQLRRLWDAFAAPWRADCTEKDSLPEALWIELLVSFLIIFGALVFSSFLSSCFSLWIIFSLLAFLAVLHLVSWWRFEKDRRLIYHFMGWLLWLMILFMAVVSVRGPPYFWYLVWSSALFRVVFFGLLISSAMWPFWATVSIPRHSSWVLKYAWLGAFVISLGAGIWAASIPPAFFGVEEFLTRLNNELGLIPLCLSRILGITSHLKISENLPHFGMMAGAIATLMGLGLVREKKASTEMDCMS